MDGLVGVIAGAGFGMALEKGGVADPVVIVSQMHLGNFRMMKMFLSALASSAATIGIMNATGLAPELKPKKLILGANIVGGAMLGAGMTMTGSCPGTVFAQVGGGYSSALLVLAGGILGGVAYSALHDPLMKAMPWLFTSTKEHHAHNHLKVPMSVLSVGMVAALTGFLTVLETYVEATPERPLLGPDFDLAKSTWSPYWAGIIIGLMQIPAWLLAKAPMGTSTGYVALLSRVQRSIGATSCAYLTQYEKKLFPLTVPIGIILGAALSAYSSGSIQAHAAMPLVATPVQQALAVVGGAMLVFGSRLANGCTSGHGISGVAQFSLSSLVTMPMMFVGAMGTAFLLPSLTLA